MPAIARVTDIGSGHGSFPDTPIITGSSRSFSNNLPRARKGDQLQEHASPDPAPTHTRVIAEGSNNVFTENLPQAVIGNKISCGGIIVKGSNNESSN